VAVVELLVALGAGDRDLLRVHDHHEVAHVDVRRVRRLALTAQRIGDLGRQPPKGPALGVDDQPVALAVGGFGYVRLHGIDTLHAQLAQRPTMIARPRGTGRIDRQTAARIAGKTREGRSESRVRGAMTAVSNEAVRSHQGHPHTL
jgi:hypothetical protein